MSVSKWPTIQPLIRVRNGRGHGPVPVSGSLATPAQVLAPRDVRKKAPWPVKSLVLRPVPSTEARAT
jgi:hypothetical protein